MIRFTDGTVVSAVDADCEYRPCYRFGFDKGPFTPGVGYTSYYPKPIQVCMTRHLSGCPHRPPELGVDRTHDDGSVTLALWDPLPCCSNPQVARPRKERPYRQRCVNCGTWLQGRRLEIVRGEGLPAAYEVRA